MAPPGFPGRAPGSRASHLGNIQTALLGRFTPAATTETERADKPSRARQARRASEGENGELSAALTEDLTAQRTAALRAVMADNPAVALAAVVHVMALPLFYDYSVTKSCLSLRLESSELRVSAKVIDETPAMRLLMEGAAVWSAQLPEQADDLWSWCLRQGSETLMSLLAYCAASSVDAVRRPHRHADASIAHADQLATALSLDMRQWWKPTAENYLARVSRKAILATVAEGVSPEAAENFRKLPKPALITHAENRLADSDWLPELLRSPARAAGE
ncbi:MAG TPA: hypothetical protein VHE81_20335 [Lacipirellulaceae bacterium]|nr:hypothetical protein [Lacipirellulaceae bacterium]